MRAAFRPRSFVRISVPPPRSTSTGWSRTTSRPSARGVLRGAAVDPESTGDRAARGAPPRAEDFLLLTEPELGERFAPSSSAPASPRRPRSSSRSTRRTSCSGARGYRRATTASRRRRCSTQGSSRRSRPRSWSCSASWLARRLGERDRRPGAAGRGRTDQRAISFTKGCSRQEPIARLHYADTRTGGCASSTLEERPAPGDRARLRGQERRPDHERRSDRDGGRAGLRAAGGPRGRGGGGRPGTATQVH